ncbi:hypothetical protein HYDPIDRAFT_96610 [Hydnomerulius pinastri MD-312]|uniref:DUF155 domain-containing protein n=1 Tax=Hydnomerulius pinastri MD-312 TaxID=994086 RepID=A0A0C9W4L5_9AGAM|nr:hypothetical protein HYDPIDRAFT_96610 [Hydnomerulius pinastri MD-312]
MSRNPLLPKTNPPSTPQVEPKTRGANRSTKVAGKLKVLPDQPTSPGPATQSTLVPTVELDESPNATGDTDDGDDEEEVEEDDEDEDVEVRLRQISQIPQGTARRDALRLTKKKAKSLPRVTAYATANQYLLHDLMKFFNARRVSYQTDPKIIDDVIYTPYAYEPAGSSDAHPKRSTQTGDLLGVPELNAPVSGAGDAGLAKKKRSKFYVVPAEAEIFVFGYGTVVIWGMTEAQEKRFLSSIRRFEVDRLASDEIEMEDLNYYYANYSRIYNDVITLRKGSGYMTKLSLSHALSQSVKISLFEEFISSKIEETKDIPESLSETGKIGMPHKEIMRKTGELFILRTNINSVGSVLDSPEVFWTYPDLQPLYDAARSYLEIPQRLDLLNTRVEVLQDMLQLLKESVSSRHAERLEQIVIALIGIEIGDFPSTASLKPRH